MCVIDRSDTPTDTPAEKRYLFYGFCDEDPNDRKRKLQYATSAEI